MDFGLQPGEGGHIGMDPGGNNATNAADPWNIDTYQDNYDYTPDDFDLSSMYRYGGPSSMVYGNPSSPNTTLSEQFFSRIDDTFKRNPLLGIAASVIPGINKAYGAYTGLRSMSNGNLIQGAGQLLGAGGVPGAGLVSAAGAASKGNLGPMAGYATGQITGNPLAAFGASQAASMLNGRTPGFNPTTSTETGFNVEGLAGGLAGLYAASRAGDGFKGSDEGNQAVQQQISSLSGMYGPNSPYAAQLRQQLERKDAAAGRRSQYGPREVQLQAALADKAAGVGDTIGRLATSNQTNQLALAKQKNQTRAQQLALLMNMGKQSGAFGALNNMFRNPTPEVTYDDSTWMGSE